MRHIDEAALLVGGALLFWLLGWLTFMTVRTHDDLNAARDELDDLQDHIATDHAGHCKICQMRRGRLLGR